MWLIEKQCFINQGSEITSAVKALNIARSKQELTLVIGNGPSLSATWLHGQDELSWAKVVQDAARKANVDMSLINSNQNNLALAQAVLVRGMDQNQSATIVRGKLVSQLHQAFRQDLPLTAIDKILTALNPFNIVTTNYDFQLERAFGKCGKCWKVLVRHDQERSSHDKSTWIHKMHGSFAPPAELATNYVFSPNFPPSQEDESIVITESDYDICYRELGIPDQRASLMAALSKTCFILGKSLDAQDISFMYALRKTRQARKQAFMLFLGDPSAADMLNAYNLGITPLIVNMPRARTSGHYYFAMVAALSEIFSDLRSFFDEAKLDSRYSKLIGGPHVVAIGLASRNITGVTMYNQQPIIPPSGRRNLQYSSVEEHIGGSALTPLMVLSYLNKEYIYRLSVVSAIGGDKDYYSSQILKAAGDLHIDTDAVSMNQEVSWHSTVLVHTSKLKDNSEYPGQRIFLDRGYKGRVTLEAAEVVQLHAQLRQEELKLVYLDKFLAAQHPPPGKEEELKPEQYGILLQKDNLELLDNVIAKRPRVEIMYETGGGGSPFQYVEKALSKRINIFTSGFPFFANVVLHKLGHSLPASLTAFSPGQQWWLADFAEEAQAIEGMLSEALKLDGYSTMSNTCRLWSFDVSDDLLREVSFWAGREATNGNWRRRWFVTTLHHFGALGVDIVHRKGWYCRPPFSDNVKIVNTSGAGDSFRGALMYAILCSERTNENTLAHALMFSTAVATERCKFFLISEACKSIARKFGGKYSDYERQPLPL